MGVLIFVAVLVIGGAVIWGGVNQGWFTPEEQAAVQQAALDAGDCETTPTLSSTVVDAINQGTSVTAGMKARVNGLYKGTVTTSTSFAKGDSVELLVNGTNYIATTLPPMTMACGLNSFTTKLSKLDGVPTVKVYGSAGDQVTDAAAGGATNESAASTPISMEMKLTVPADEAINGMVFVFESTNDTDTEEITLSSSTATVTKYKSSKPQFHSQESAGTNSFFTSYHVTNIPDDGAQTTFGITITPESGKTIDETAFYMTWYVEDTYVDTDGTFQTGIEDSDGTAKHVEAADADYDWMVT